MDKISFQRFNGVVTKQIDSIQIDNNFDMSHVGRKEREKGRERERKREREKR